MTLSWGRCEGNQWCPFLTVNLGHPVFRGLEGVYIIWHGGPAAATVRVGQGTIADRIVAHRLESEILQYSSLGLFITWAPVDATSRDGVERFLFDQLRPKAGVRAPNARPIQVNLPW